MTCAVDTESVTRLARWTSAVLMALVGMGGEDHASLRCGHGPAAIGDERREEPHHQRDQHQRDLTDRWREHRRPAHDEHQPGGGRRCQARPNAQEPG
jgi:hypothetical protein